MDYRSDYRGIYGPKSIGRPSSKKIKKLDKNSKMNDKSKKLLKIQKNSTKIQKWMKNPKNCWKSNSKKLDKIQKINS